jgi:catechol 2,3-dioxygenase-like lactoylglutathione lyase family enzyme
MNAKTFAATALLFCASVFSTFSHAQKRPAITGIAFMRVYTSDPAAADKFYGPMLGFEKHDVDGTWVYPVNHTQWLEVLSKATPPAPNNHQAAVAFMTADAAGLEKYLNAKGVATVEPLKDGEFGVHDPEGNLVIFVQRGAKAADAKIAADAKYSPNATSHRIIHVGFIVRDQPKEDAFWRGILGFRPYWIGTSHPGRTDYVSQQVPDGDDWLEYMLSASNPATPNEAGVDDHVSLGAEHIQTVLAALERNGCTGPECRAFKAGVDGKIQLNMYDPDHTRVEFMEFAPVLKPCCSPFTGKHPEEAKEK